MKIVKRDGRTVDYDPLKIHLAINKANQEVEESKRLSDKYIDKIVQYIESLGKKRILVEDIQDIIEEKLMEYKKYELAKCYIIYRHNRALIRKSNNTDENILGIIKSQNKRLVGDSYKKNCAIAALQRDIVAGEISKDITKRVLLPEKIISAHEEGLIYFHDMDYFIHSIFNACYVNIEDMLNNGTVMNGITIESPKSFQVACNVTTQILSQVASGQYGATTINVSKLSPYLKKSYLKIKKKLTKLYKDKISPELMEELIEERTQTELSNGVQTLLYQTNTLMTSTGKPPFVTLVLHLDKDDPLIDLSAKIINKIIDLFKVGILDEDGSFIKYQYPKLVYILSDNNDINKKYGYITENLLNTITEIDGLTIISEPKMKELFGSVYGPLNNNMFLSPYKENGEYKVDGRFITGMVSINLTSACIDANYAIDKFFKILEDRLELSKDALLCRYRSLLNVSSDVSPIHWQYGGITRIATNEKIDNYLKNGYSNLVLGYSGLEECANAMDNENKLAIKTKILHFINEKIKSWNKENEIVITLYNNLDIGSYFIKKDYERFGIIKNLTDKDSYDNDHYIDLNNYESQTILQDMSLGGYTLKIKKEDLTVENLSIIKKNIWYVEVE